MSRFVEDHIPAGKYHNPSTQLQAETKSVPQTNVKDFSQWTVYCIKT